MALKAGRRVEGRRRGVHSQEGDSRTVEVRSQAEDHSQEGGRILAAVHSRVVDHRSHSLEEARSRHRPPAGHSQTAGRTRAGNPEGFCSMWEQEILKQDMLAHACARPPLDGDAPPLHVRHSLRIFA